MNRILVLPFKWFDKLIWYEVNDWVDAKLISIWSFILKFCYLTFWLNGKLMIYFDSISTINSDGLWKWNKFCVDNLTKKRKCEINQFLGNQIACTA